MSLRESAPVRQVEPSPCTAPLRVLHVSSGNLYGGVETLLVTLARFRHLCPEMEPHFALSFEGRLSQELSKAGVPVHLLGKVRLSRPWTVWRGRRRLKGLLRSKRFDVVICHMPWTLAVFGKAVRASGCPLGFWMHNPTTALHWLDRLAKHTLPDLVLANSHFTEPAAISFSPDAVHGILYSPVPDPTETASKRWYPAARKELGVAHGTVVIAQVSRMEEWKGHLSLIAALARLKDTSTPWTCWMVGGVQRSGEQAYYQRLQRTASDLGIADHVQFLGQRNDVPRLLAGADIFCQPNHSPEPFGIVFVEALWAGLPVVATSIGGAKEILDSHCGILIPPDNPDLLAEALRSLIESPAKRSCLGDHGPARADYLCNPATQMKKLANLCKAATRCRASVTNQLRPEA